ncbi:MAG TPA: exosortase/archaeosortase family protein [Verrucomicrobiae bacterium]|nr:exosortase/archaeosortase family protein [Verrucomicrobiae bacterium]
MNEIQTSETRPNLWQDTADCWQRLPNKAFFFGLLAAWLAIFQFWGNPILGYIKTASLFGWLYNAYNAPYSDDGHGNLIPFLVVGIFWWKRQELLALPLKIWLPGLFILLFALALHIFGFLVQQPYFSIVALFTGIFGLMGLAWGRDWLRHGFFPFWLFIFSIPLGEHGQIITFPLQQAVSWLTEKCAHGLGIDVLRNGTQLFDPSGKYAYEVAAACSGIRSLVAIFLLAAVYGFIIFRSPWKRIFLLALAPPFAVIGNLLRMLLIILAATIGGQRAGDFVHENWLISLIPYIPAIAGFLLIGRWLENRELKKSSA